MAIRQKGSKFQVDVTVKGVRAPRVSADSLQEAEKIEAKFKAHLLNGGDPADLAEGTTSKPVKGATMADLLNVAIVQKWSGTKAEASSVRNGTVWCDMLGYDFPVADLNAEAVQKVCEKLAISGNSAGTINRKLAALGVMLGFAETNGWCVRFKLPKRKEYDGRLRYYTDEEEADMLDFFAYDTAFWLLLKLAFETGMRQGELLGLTKFDVKLEQGLIALGETKGNERRKVLLTDAAIFAVQKLIDGKKSHEKLFPDTLGSRAISRHLARWKAHRELPEDDEACFHSIRHTTCSRLVQDGVPLSVVQVWMGHKSIDTTMRYAHLAPDSLNLALASLNKRKAA